MNDDKNEKLNVLLIGANLYGEMASSQRVFNLFSPMIEMYNVMVTNLVHRQCLGATNNSRVRIVEPSCEQKIVNRIQYLFLLYKIIDHAFRRDSINIIYHYGYPALSTMRALSYAKKKGYVVVFDIVENIYAYTVKTMSISGIKVWVERQAIHKISKIGSACFAISDSLVRLCKDITHSEIPVYLLPISVDVNKLSAVPKRHKKANEISIFYGGSFGKKDGIRYLIESFTRAWGENQDLRLILTGRIAKEDKGELQTLLATCASKSAINYLGCLPIDDYYAEMASADILCMPRVNTLFANSGFPFKLGEYLASGNAVVATKTSDVCKYLQHKKSAYLIPPESIDDMVEAFMQLSMNRELRTSIGQNGQKVASDFFDIRVVSIYLYERLCLINQ